jgi:anti-sigma regulatory factor (Ser/Thr protein kinase)
MSEVALAHIDGEGLTTSRTVRLRVPARPEYIALARLALRGLADLALLSEDDLVDLKLALSEAVSNSVRHASPGGDGFVSITYELTAAALEIEVVDDGPFDLVVSAPHDGERLSGRGSRLRFAKSQQPGV